LAADDVQRQSGAPFARRFADAHDRNKARTVGRLRFRLDHPVELAVRGPALGVTDDDSDSARVSQHFS
jgi:hypothetical protein